MEDLVARTQAAHDRARVAEQQRSGAFKKVIVHAVKVAIQAAGQEADKGKQGCRVSFHTDHPLLQPSSVYDGYYNDSSFTSGIMTAMADYGFFEERYGRVEKRRGGTIVVVKYTNAKAKPGQTVGLRIILNWSVGVGKKEPPKPPPSESNVNLHCPVCMEDTPANVLVPCGHHVCKACTGKLRQGNLRQSADVHVPCCPVCSAAFHRTQLVFGDRKRKHAQC